MSNINCYISCTFSGVYYFNYFIFLNLVKYVIFIVNTRPLKHIFCFNY